MEPKKRRVDETETDAAIQRVVALQDELETINDEVAGQVLLLQRQALQHDNWRL